jgi:thiamine pyrophosphate-dependent acetolactate synthase large subunit-like protein
MLRDDVATVLGRSAYHLAAAGLGAEGILVQKTEEVPAALARARELARAGKPILINLWLDKTDFREGSISM